jgi:hypothetical protein
MTSSLPSFSSLLLFTSLSVLTLLHTSRKMDFFGFVSLRRLITYSSTYRCTTRRDSRWLVLGFYLTGITATGLKPVLGTGGFLDRYEFSYNRAFPDRQQSRWSIPRNGMSARHHECHGHTVQIMAHGLQGSWILTKQCIHIKTHTIPFVAPKLQKGFSGFVGVMGV